MDLRSSRSRSRTPFVQLTRLEEENMANAIKQRTVEQRRVYSTRQKTIEQKTIEVDDDVCEYDVKQVKQTRQRHKTSDYSSEEEYTGNGTVKSALQVYKEAGEYWNKYPKTDYTYSLHSKDRMEVAPGVICMPNMSRKSLRRSAEPSPRYNADPITYTSNNSTRKTLNFDETHEFKTTKNISILRRTTTTLRSVITRFYQTIITLLMVVYTSVETSMLWLARSYYKTVSRLFLFDTWLMQKSTATTTQSSKKYGALIAIMLLPLLLFAGWTLLSALTQLYEERTKNEETRTHFQQIPETPDIKQLLNSPEFQEIVVKHLDKKYNEMKVELSATKARINELSAGLASKNKCCRRQFIYLPNKIDEAGIEARLERFQQELSRNLGGLSGTITDAQIRRIVQDSLAVYDADKTGLVDYALESSGGQILSTRCTENYHSRTAVVSILGVPLWWPSNTPRVIITPGVTPGECWAFQNFPGFVVIQLSSVVRVTGVSLEHIPEVLAPQGARDSAPRVFSVWGLMAENDRQPWSFGTFEYRLEGPPLQYFTLEDADTAPPFNIVELRVESNHGNMNYTCLYRFRVHGHLT